MPARISYFDYNWFGRGWQGSPTCHWNQRGLGALHPKNWPADAWKKCGCAWRQWEMFPPALQFDHVALVEYRKSLADQGQWRDLYLQQWPLDSGDKD